MHKLSDWIIEDLAKSGLAPDDIEVGELKSNVQLSNNLSRTHFQGESLLKIGGYFIVYPRHDCYRRLKLKTLIGKVKYISPNNGGNKLYIPKQIYDDIYSYKPDNPIFITEGEKKSACGTKYGFPTIGLAGVYCYLDKEGEIEDFKSLNLSSRKVYLVFDNDIDKKTQVKQAELRLAVHVINKGGKPFSVRLPNSDEKIALDDYLVEYGAENFKDLVNKAKKTFQTHIEENTNPEIILKELSKVEKLIDKDQITKSLANQLKISLDSVRKQLSIIVKKELEGENESKENKEVFTAEELDFGLENLKSATILDDMLGLMHKVGVVGEKINLKTLILCFISRLFDKSLHIIIHGQSSSGKSYLVNQALRVIPEYDVIKTSFLTPKALAHYKNDLDHKILLIQEQEGADGSDYSIRTAISEGEIKIITTEKNEATGHFEAVENNVSSKGLVTVITTTRDRVHFENETRVLDGFSDESEEQTKKIVKSLGQNIKVRDYDSEFKHWQAGISQLKPYEVIIPYAPVLAEEFVTTKVRSRRDFFKLLMLIKSHTLLNQLNQEKDSNGNLIATIKDFEDIYEIANSVLSQSYAEKSNNQQKVLEIVSDTFSTSEFGSHELYKIEDIQRLNLSFRTIERYLKSFVKDGHIIHNGERGKLSRYSLGDSVSLSRLSLFSTPNLSALLDKIDNSQRQLGKSSRVVNVASSVSNDNGDMRRHKQMSLKNNRLSKDYNELIDNKSNNDTTTQKLDMTVPEYLV